MLDSWNPPSEMLNMWWRWRASISSFTILTLLKLAEGINKVTGCIVVLIKSLKHLFWNHKCISFITRLVRSWQITRTNNNLCWGSGPGLTVFPQYLPGGAACSDQHVRDSLRGLATCRTRDKVRPRHHPPSLQPSHCSFLFYDLIWKLTRCLA